MPTYSLRRFSRPHVLATISPDRLLDLLRPFAAFFRRRGLALPTTGAAFPRADLERLAKVLVTPDVDTPPALADTLYYVHEMATTRGMDALLRKVSLADLNCGPLGMEPADVAVRVWLHDRRVLERTHAEISASHPRRFEYFQTYLRQVPPFTAPADEQLRPLEAALDREFERRNRGRGVRVFAYPHGNDCLFLVRHGDPYRREGTLHGGEASDVLYRPLRFDIVGYDGRNGTLRVHAGSNWETSLYRGQFGKHLFGAMDHFPGEGRYTLRPLHRDGEASLACGDVPELKFVALTEVRLDWGGPYKEVETRRAKNVFAALHRRRERLADREVIRATFELHFRGSREGRPLVLEPPNVALYARDEDSQVADRWLANRGFIRRPLPEADGDTRWAVLAGR